MLDKYYYTDAEQKQLLRSVIILVDTREKENKHIIDFFDQKKIKYKSKALSNGDYSFYIPRCPELNIERDMYFDKDIFVERKASLDELAGNFTKNRTRFEEEMATSNAKKYLLIENSTYSELVGGKYRSQYIPKSYLATLHTFNHRYGLEVFMLKNKTESGLWIYNTLIYYLRELLR